MASLVGNVSRDGMCANSSTKCANGGVSMDGTTARDSSGKSAEVGGAGLGGLCTAQKRGSGDQHACRLHVNHDARKSGFYPAKRGFPEEGPSRTKPRWGLLRSIIVRVCPFNVPCDRSLRVKVVRKAAGFAAGETARSAIAPALQSSIS
jgi:hypothetical protein